MKKTQTAYFIYVVLLGFIMASCNSTTTDDDSAKKSVAGPYLGQSLPGTEAEIFAPGIINIGPHTRDLAITPDGKEIYFCMSVPPYSTIMFTRLDENGWSDPEVVEHLSDPNFYNFEPCLSPDGDKLYFLSNRPDTANNETTADQDIWIMERTESGWGVPYNLGSPVNSPDEEYYPSITNDGTLYFTRARKGETINYIYRSKLVDGKYSEPELLPENVNCGKNRYNAYIDRDESFIIVPAEGMTDSFGGTDYYISFRNNDDEWSLPVNMGANVNTAGSREYSASLSPDKKILFFMSQRELKIPDNLTRKTMRDAFFEPGNSNSAIYWIDASLIAGLRSKL